LILVVDGDAAVREFLKDLLMQHGYGVWAVSSGAMAIPILRERRIDLIVGDASCIEPDGEKTIRKLRRSRPETKILAMTGASRAMAPEWLQARFLGADAILPKPVSADLLLQTAEKLLGDNG
jgi:CheY-like chemotaxis protein